MLLFFCARWEDHRRLSGGCETFCRSIPMTPRRYRFSRSQMSLWPVILPRKGLYQQRKHLTEEAPWQVRIDVRMTEVAFLLLGFLFTPVRPSGRRTWPACRRHS